MPYKDKATYNEYMRNYYHTRKGQTAKKPLTVIKEELDNLRSENAILKFKLKQEPEPISEQSYNDYSEADTDDETEDDEDIFTQFDTQTLGIIYNNIKNFASRNDINYDEVQKEFILRINKNAAEILELLNDDEKIVICNYLKSKAILLWCNSYHISFNMLLKEGKIKP